MAWDDRFPSYEMVAEYWCGRLIPGSDRIALEFPDEPQCFACGWCRLWQFRSREALKDIWKGLQRAHVIARSLGGPDAVENLALLCEPCHKDSPDTGNPDIFWRWVVEHPRNGSIDYLRFDNFRMADYRGPLANYYHGLGALTDDELTALISIVKQNYSGLLEQLDAARERLGGVTTHGGNLSSGTITAMFREIIRHELGR